MAERRYEQCWMLSTVLAAPPPVLTMSEEALRAQHQAYIHELDEKGLLVGAGSLRDETGARFGTGMIIIRAATREEAERLAQAEPYIANGVRVLTLIPWQRTAGR